MDFILLLVVFVIWLEVNLVLLPDLPGSFSEFHNLILNHSLLQMISVFDFGSEQWPGLF